MNDETREAAKSHLATLVKRAMSDGAINQTEREELNKAFRQSALSPADVQQVLQEYLQLVKAEVMADGVVTPEERARVVALVDQLKIPLGMLPRELLNVVLGKLK